MGILTRPFSALLSLLSSLLQLPSKPPICRDKASQPALIAQKRFLKITELNFHQTPRLFEFR